MNHRVVQHAVSSSRQRQEAAPEKILLVNFDFPPGLAGVRRVVKLAKYLPEFGFDPVVLASSPNSRMPLDMETLEEVERGGYPVYRTPAIDHYRISEIGSGLTRPLQRLRALFDLAAKTPAAGSTPVRKVGKGHGFIRRLLSLPDDRIGWLATAIPEAEQLLKRHAIRYVFTSSYPHSTHLVGLYLKKRFKIHWHADFRDGWMQNPYFADWLTPAHRTFSGRLEQRVVAAADTVTAVSEPISAYLANFTIPSKLMTLPNGYDPEDYEGPEQEPFDLFTIAYTGTMFMQRSPDSFFAALRGLLDAHPGLAGNFQVLFMSNIKAEHQKMLEEMQLGQVVKFLGLGSYQESIALQKRADALLVIEGRAENSNIMLTQKVFEYLAARKPILALTPPDTALAVMIRETKSVITIDPENVFRIKETLMELFLGRITWTRNEEMIRQFDRRLIAQSLAGMLRNHDATVSRT